MVGQVHQSYHQQAADYWCICRLRDCHQVECGLAGKKDQRVLLAMMKYITVSRIQS